MTLLQKIKYFKKDNFGINCQFWLKYVSVKKKKICKNPENRKNCVASCWRLEIVNFVKKLSWMLQVYMKCVKISYNLINKVFF